MEVKTLEIRDRMTLVPMMAIKLGPRNEGERYLWARSGYGITSEDQTNYVLLSKIDGNESRALVYDPRSWGDRTFSTAHKYIQDHWDEIENGQVIDVEYILGETQEPKKSDRHRI